MARDDKFQGLCLVNEPGAGATYMSYFDSFSEGAKRALHESRFNLCAACFEGYVDVYGATYEECREAVLLMEELIISKQRTGEFQ